MQNNPIIPPCGSTAEHKPLRELEHHVAALEEQERREREQREKEKLPPGIYITEDGAISGPAAQLLEYVMQRYNEKRS
jgi:hypothetical protein